MIITEIYGAGEEAIPGICGEALYQAIKRRGHLEVEFIPDKKKIARQLVPKLRPGDIVLTLGAGDIYRVGEEIVERLQR